MATVNELPTILWNLVKDFFQRDKIMEVTKINYDDTLDLLEWNGEENVGYEQVHVLRDPFTKGVVLNVNVGDRVVVTFIDGDKNNPVVLGIIQE